jgi:hypothetical protein
MQHIPGPQCIHGRNPRHFNLKAPPAIPSQNRLSAPRYGDIRQTLGRKPAKNRFGVGP